MNNKLQKLKVASLCALVIMAAFAGNIPSWSQDIAKEERVQDFRKSDIVL